MMRWFNRLFGRYPEPILRQYQLDGITFMKERGRVFVDLETDFGKTIEMSSSDGWMSPELREFQARSRIHRKPNPPVLIDLTSLEQLDALIKGRLPEGS